MVFNATVNNILETVQNCICSVSDCYEHVFLTSRRKESHQ